MTKDRIKLAEAVGWEFHEGRIDDRYWCISSVDAGYPDKYHSKWRKAPGKDWECALCYEDTTPDPFTDANDDYAVLEHFRNMPHCLTKKRFRNELFINGTSMGRGMYEYRIGDYARFALKVLDND